MVRCATGGPIEKEAYDRIVGQILEKLKQAKEALGIYPGLCNGSGLIATMCY